MSKVVKDSAKKKKVINDRGRALGKNDGPIVRQEIKLIKIMIQLYYRHLDQASEITEEQMQAYAKKRLEVCRFGEEKPTCQHCPIHCYQKKYRQQMKLVMRYSGPRILFSHPILALKHAYRGLTRRITL